MTVRIFDADKKPVAAEIQRTDRVDVNQLFEEAQDPGKTGFFSEITNVSGKMPVCSVLCRRERKLYMWFL